MESYSFTTEDTSKYTKNTFESITQNDPKYNKRSKDKLIEQFNLDITRNKGFFIETKEGSSNLIDECEKVKASGEKSGEKLKYEDFFALLTSKYKLSEDQADYILKTTHQDGIAASFIGVGGIATHETSSYCDKLDKEKKKITAIMNSSSHHAGLLNSESKLTDLVNYNRLGCMSKIIIDADNNLSYVAGQKIICGLDKATIYNDPSTAEIFARNAHTQFISEDYVAINITAKIGKVGSKDFNSSVEFDVAAEGKIGLEVIKQLKEIKSSLPSKDPELIVKNYHDFANSILDQTGSNELYKQEVREEVRNILSSSNYVEPQKIENLKKLEFTKTALAEQLMDKIDKKIDDFKKNHPDQPMTSREITGVANEVTVDLQKFIDKPQGYLERFAKDLVKERVSSNEVELPRQSFVNKIVSYLKDVWHSYSKENLTIGRDNTLEQIKEQAKNIGKNIDISSGAEDKNVQRDSTKKKAAVLERI